MFCNLLKTFLRDFYFFAMVVFIYQFIKKDFPSNKKKYLKSISQNQQSPDILDSGRSTSSLNKIGNFVKNLFS